MKILQLVDTLRAGGAERMVVNISAVLKENSIENMIVVSRSGGMQESRVPSGVVVEFIHKKSAVDVIAFRNLLATIQAFQPSHLHAHATSLYWAVLVKMRFPSIKLIWHDHYGLSDHLQPSSRFIERKILGWVDRVIVVNDKLEKWILESTSVDKEKVKMLPNFPYLNLKGTSKTNPTEKFKLLHLANFRPQKNHFTLLKALEILRQDYKDICFHLVLAGSTSVDISYTEKVIAFVKQSNLVEYVEVAGEIEDVESYLAESHIGILSSDSEGLPVSLLEYGLGRLPVVVTAVGQCEEVLMNGKLGTLVPAGDPNALARGIYETASNYQEALRRAELLKRRIDLDFGGSLFFKQYIDFIK